MKRFDKELYKLDFDANGILGLTEKNSIIIDSVLKIDPTYRFTFDRTDESSAYYYVYHNADSFEKNENIISEICKRINKENSTHIYVSGHEKGSNQGLMLTVKQIVNIDKLKERLKTGDIEIVTTIANAVPGRNNISFASKFCTYMCRYMFEGSDIANNYVVYDSVLADMLPYFAWYYRIEGNYIKKNGKSKIPEIEYKDYCVLFNTIRQKASLKAGYSFSTKEFDSMIWYYYKGSLQRRELILKKLIEGDYSRID